MAVVDDRGFFITLRAIRRQLAAMPNELYLVRLIHHLTRRAFPGERLWTADQLGSAATVRFLRVRNREGCDVYVQPYAANQNAGYILVDLDRAQPAVIATLRAHGHDPCVVLQTSPGHLQAWIHLSASPLEPAVATAAGKLLALAYGGDCASTDWRHLGRLAGFTNQKPVRRTPGGYAPWVKVVDTKLGLATRAAGLLQSARALASPHPVCETSTFQDATPLGIAASVATEIYQGATMAHPSALSSARLEHRGFVGRQALAVAGMGSRSGPTDSPAGQPTVSPRPRGSRRLPAPDDRSRCFPLPSPPCVYGSCLSLQSLCLFELDRRPVPQRRM